MPPQFHQTAYSPKGTRCPALCSLLLLLCAGAPTSAEPPGQENAERITKIQEELFEPDCWFSQNEFDFLHQAIQTTHSNHMAEVSSDTLSQEEQKQAWEAFSNELFPPGFENLSRRLKNSTLRLPSGLEITFSEYLAARQAFEREKTNREEERMRELETWRQGWLTRLKNSPDGARIPAEWIDRIVAQYQALIVGTISEVSADMEKSHIDIYLRDFDVLFEYQHPPPENFDIPGRQ